MLQLLVRKKVVANNLIEEIKRNNKKILSNPKEDMKKGKRIKNEG